jgi:hypothetical protein
METKEQQMTYTFDSRIVSDLHKDAFGFRPSTYFWEEWNGASDDAKQMIWDDLQDALDRAMEYDRLREDAAIADYHSEIANLIATGAANEHQARKWMVQALKPTEMDLRYGGSWVCFELGLPYSMSAVFEDVCSELERELEVV